MLDASQVEAFAAKLQLTLNPVTEEAWQAEWSGKVADEMRNNAPVDTGRLRDSIRVSNDGVEVGVDYGGFVEYGTAHTAPQPYATPAVNRLIKQSAVDATRRVIRELT